MLEPRTIRITFPGDIADALTEVSLNEHRHPADQAIVFVRDRLGALGALPLDVTTNAGLNVIEPQTNAYSPAQRQGR